ncbi:sorbitol dehydrogenase-like [Mercenaria mercenaria]|uniref:sorbitol dehydrogenase-like n=1 Tax=Mercenaria mercenaria TaxID=6596 RepID=UPI00234F390B|nr:sorbitol dehydrogenase-like [Mercenaria mercenaria]
MTEKNLAAVFYKQGDIRLQETKIPEPAAGQVQIRIENVGICGSDLSFWERDGIPGVLEGGAPFAIGHEGAGVVSKLGQGVTSLKIGDKVALDPLFNCGHCTDCKTGRYNLCTGATICGFPEQWGYMTRLFVQNAEHCFQFPSHVSTEEGAMLEPLAVALHACRRAGVSANSKVLITGAGPIGLLAMMSAKVFGASSVCMTEVNETRIKLAKQLGADYVLNVTSKEPRDVAKSVEECFGEKPNMAIECSGAQSAMCAAIYATRSGGCMTQVGLGDAKVTVPLTDASFREVDITGVRSNLYCTPLAADLVASGRIDVKPLVTHRYELENVAEAFKRAHLRKGGKVMVRCSKD